MSANRVGPWMALILFVTVWLAKIIGAVFTCLSTRDPAWFYSSVLEDRLNEDDIPDSCDEIAAGYSRNSSFYVGNDVLFQMKDAITEMEICVGRSSDCSIGCFPVKPAMLTTANSLHPNCPRLTDLYSGEGASFAGTASLLTGQCNDGGGNFDGPWSLAGDVPTCLLACATFNANDCWNLWSVNGIDLGFVGGYSPPFCGIKTWYNQIHTHGSGLSFANMGFKISQYGGNPATGLGGREMSFHDTSNAARAAHDIFQIRLKVNVCDPLPEFNFGEGYAEDEVKIFEETFFTQKCSAGYSANDGGGVYSCPGGTFTGTVLECTADACDTTAINTGDKYSTNCESMKTNDQCEQACAEGYESTQGVSEVYTCPEGSFEGTPLICEDVDECLSPNCLEMDYCANGVGTYSCSCPPYYMGDNVNSRCELAILCPMGYIIGEEGSTEPCVCHPAYSGCGWDADAQDYIIPISPATRPVVLLMGCFSTAALSWYIDASGGV